MLLRGKQYKFTEEDLREGVKHPNLINYCRERSGIDLERLSKLCLCSSEDFLHFESGEKLPFSHLIRFDDEFFRMDIFYSVYRMGIVFGRDFLGLFPGYSRVYRKRAERGRSLSQ